MATTKDMEKRLADIIKFIDEATAKIQGGTVPDLKSLDTDVTTFCKDMETADPVTAKLLKPQMGSLITKLDQLAHILQDHQDKKKKS